MYVCQMCSKQSQKGEKATKVVTESRIREYVYKDGHGNLKTSTGSEIVKEVVVGPCCAVR